jgi:arginyl-tRNA synthetase
MPDLTGQTFQDQLRQTLYAALQEAFAAGQLGQLAQIPKASEVVFQPPKNPTYGDYASPIALSLAKPAGMNPLQIAEILVEYLDRSGFSAEVAKPGFINFKVQDSLLAKQLALILNQGSDYGRTTPAKPRKILLEFVSANPTGPLHVGHGRWAAIGSTLANLLRFAGDEVTTEFYINDAGNQMSLLGQSLGVRYFQELGYEATMPEKGYQGDYIKDLAQTLIREWKDIKASAPVDWFTDYACQHLLQQQKETLAAFRTEFDHWYSERTLHEEGIVQKAMDDLEKRGMLYRADTSQTEQAEVERETDEGDGSGALFFKAAQFGDDKDRVIQRSNGLLTYLAADIAYHREKFERGYDLLINIWGADHHGYVPRVKAAMQALGHPPEDLEIIIGQLVKLLKLNPETGKKEEVRMSKRTGNFITLDDLIYGIDSPEDAVGPDAARWFILSQSADSSVNLDLDLAVKRDTDNPVYYVQYAHTRACSVFRNLGDYPELLKFLANLRSGFNPETLIGESGFLLDTPEERALILRLINAPDQFRRAAEERAPQILVRYSEELANDFMKFYDRCRILPLLRENPKDALAYARGVLMVAAKQVLSTALGLLGISAPESM